MLTLDRIFPEIQEQIAEKEEMEIATIGHKKTILDKSRRQSLKHNVKVFMLEKNGYDKETLASMFEGSSLLNMCLHKHLND